MVPLNTPHAALRSVLRVSPGRGLFKGARHSTELESEHVTVSNKQMQAHASHRKKHSEVQSRYLGEIHRQGNAHKPSPATNKETLKAIQRERR